MMLGEEQDDLLGADGDWPSFEEKMASILEPANTPPPSQVVEEEQLWEEWGEQEDSIRSY